MRVLIADDNRDSADTLAMLCDTWGYESTVVFDGDSALATLRQPDAPKLCLLDWEMPGATGIDICAALRKEREIPYRYLILITGRATANDPRFARSERLRARADKRHLHEWQSYSPVQGLGICRLLPREKAELGSFPAKS